MSFKILLNIRYFSSSCRLNLNLQETKQVEIVFSRWNNSRCIDDESIVDGGVNCWNDDIFFTLVQIIKRSSVSSRVITPSLRIINFNSSNFIVVIDKLIIFRILLLNNPDRPRMKSVVLVWFKGSVFYLPNVLVRLIHKNSIIVNVFTPSIAASFLGCLI